MSSRAEGEVKFPAASGGRVLPGASDKLRTFSQSPRGPESEIPACHQSHSIRCQGRVPKIQGREANPRAESSPSLRRHLLPPLSSLVSQMHTCQWQGVLSMPSTSTLSNALPRGGEARDKLPLLARDHMEACARNLQACWGGRRASMKGRGEYETPSRKTNPNQCSLGAFPDGQGWLESPAKGPRTALGSSYPQG